MLAHNLLLANVEAAHSGEAWKTALFALLLVSMIVALALEEKLHAKKSVIVGVFALVCLLLGAALEVLPFEKIVIGSFQVVDHTPFSGERSDPEDAGPEDPDDVNIGTDDPREVSVGGHRVEMPVYIPAIEWGVIAIILGSSLFVDVTSRSGLFSWIAIKVTKATGGDPMRLLAAYGLMTVVFSAVLNNVTAMIIIGSLTVVSLEKLGLKNKLLGFLLIEGLLTNIGGLLTLISSVPNIIVGTKANISFVEFFIKASPYVVVATIVTVAMGARLFGIHRLGSDAQREEGRRQVAGFDENDAVSSPGFFWFSAGMTVLFILAIATTSALPLGINELGMGFVALAFAGIMLIPYKAVADQFYKTLDWDLLVFFMGLFVVINVMEHAGVLGAIGGGLDWLLFGGEQPVDSVTNTTAVLVGAAGFSSVTDNIPLAAMLANILGTLNTPTDSALWWSVIFGANLGGNLTPIGSASTLVAVTIIHKHKLSLSFGGFVKMAFPFAVVQIVLATAYVLLILRGW